MSDNLIWGAIFATLGALILALTPPVNPLAFLAVGWLALAVGAGFICRHILHGVDE